jgi:hypothetical protein
MSDNGLVALAAALHKAGVNCMNPVALSRDVCLPTKRAGDFHNDHAAAILGALDALPGMLWDDLSYQAGLEDGRNEQTATIATLRDDLAHCERAWEDAGTEIATLRTALNGLVEAGEVVSDYLDAELAQTVVPDGRVNALRAALAQAKEAK